MITYNCCCPRCIEYSSLPSLLPKTPPSWNMFSSSIHCTTGCTYSRRNTLLLLVRPPSPPYLYSYVFCGNGGACVQVVKVQMQAKENLGRYTGVANCAASLLQTEGPFGLYKGLESHLWRNAVWNGAFVFFVLCLPAARVWYILPSNNTRHFFSCPFGLARDRLQLL